MGPLECLREIYKKAGIQGVFKGLGLTIAREVPSFSSYFFTYEFLTRSDCSAPVSTSKMLFAGGMAGRCLMNLICIDRDVKYIKKMLFFLVKIQLLF